jgi:succinoglycan biosynthesis transport protein ExoP
MRPASKGFGFPLALVILVKIYSTEPEWQEETLSELGLPEFSNENPLKELQLRDYLGIVRRRKLWIILPSIGTFVLAVVIALRMPNTYHSQTVILVDPQQVPNSYVPSTVTETVTDRLSMIRQLVLSPTRLSSLIHQLHLFGYTNGKDDQRLVALMQKSIIVEVSDAGSQRLSAFKIAYTSGDPHEAAEVANRLARAVVDENLKAREQQFSGTEDFLNTELQETKRQLEEKESEVGRIKTQYIMDLPESKQFHLEALDNLRMQLRNTQDRVNRAEQEKVYLQSMLVNSNPSVDMDANSDVAAQSTSALQIQKLETSLSELRARYGPNYPDVRKLQSQIGALKAKESQEEASAPVREVVPRPIVKRNVKNPVVEAQLAKLDQEIADQTKLQPQLQEQINFHESKLGQVPIFEGRIAGLMRDYDTLRSHYNSLLERKLSAEMASALEEHQKGERYVILDPAPVPDKPFGPNRGLISLAGLFGGLFGGFSLAMIRELTDESVRSEKEAARLFGAAVLAGIPNIESSRQLLLNRLRIFGATVATVICAAGVGYLVSYVTRWNY